MTGTRFFPKINSRIPETQLAERLHGERYYGDARMSVMAPTPVHGSHLAPHGQHHHIPNSHGVRIDLGNHMVGTDNLHTILRSENPRNVTNKSYYYG